MRGGTRTTGEEYQRAVPPFDHLLTASRELGPATRLAMVVIDGADWPRTSQVSSLSSEYADLHRAVIIGSMYIMDRTFEIRRKDPEDVHATKARRKWEQYGFDAAYKVDRSGSMSHTFYECMQTVAKVHQWVLTDVVTPIVIE